MKQCRLGCIHEDACRMYLDNGDWWNISEDCPHYKDKSLFVELPCKIGDHLYFGNYKGEVVENEIIDIRYRTITNGGFYNDISIDRVGKTVYLTRQEGQDEAERKVQELRDLG